MVEKYYTQKDIYSTIISRLQAAGRNTANITRKDLAAIDEFHIGGAEITRQLAAQLDLKPGMRILDVGCGLGGACRLFADEYGCHATGIDITAAYIDTAKQLSALTHLQQGTDFVQGSATDLPFNNQHFDMAWTQHVQMNVADKQKMYEEIARVLVAGGRFIYYDVFSTGDPSIYLPLPWADDASMNHLVTTTAMKELLQNAGLQLLSTTDQTAKSIAGFEKMLPYLNQKRLPALGNHLLMGGNAIEKLENLFRNLSEKKVVVESGIAMK